MQLQMPKRIEQISAQEFESLELRTTEGKTIRCRTYSNDDLLRTIKAEYQEWKNSISDPERDSLNFWYSRGFRSIHAELRNRGTSKGLDPKIVIGHIENISSAIQAAPSVPKIIEEVYRGESHQRISLQEAQDLCDRGQKIQPPSFLAASVLENEAFNFARDYHSSGYTEAGLMIPIAALMKPVDQQIIYRYKFPEDRSEIKAAWIGNSIAEILFPIKTAVQYESVEEVVYLPQETIDQLNFSRINMTQALEYAEPRLFITMRLVGGGIKV